MELSALVRSGGIANELLRPVGLFGNWYARSVALRTAPTLLRAVPLLLFAWLVGGLALPPGAVQAFLWVASTGAAVLLSAALTTILSMTLLWNLAGEGVRWLVNPCVWVLSGLLMPLPLFPDRLQWLIRALPFRGMMDIPCRIWSGDIAPSMAVAEIVGQLAWAAALAGVGIVVARRGARHLVIAGG
jgi:ABC-2 type transport system permease protein